MASNLASIHGTEKDRVNCPFFLKVGACRHGDRCSRLHTRPTESQTLILANMYVFPNATLPIQQQNSHFEDFYEDVFEELSKHGDIEELHVCDNLSDHMIGNVYVKFLKEEQAAAAKSAFSGRYYAERPMVLDFSPVTDFREASCWQYEERSCQKGGYCNFLHLKRISRELRRKLYGRGRRYDDKDGGRQETDCRRSDRQKRLDRRRSRSRSPPSKKGRGREGSVERRAKIELWNHEREEFQASAAASEHDNGAHFRCQEQVQCYCKYCNSAAAIDMNTL